MGDATKNWSGDGVVDKDLGWSELVKILAKTKNLSGEVGNIRKRKYSGKNVTVAKVMGIQEARTGFITRFVERIQENWPIFLKKMAKQIIANRITPHEVLEEYLEKSVDEFRSHITKEGLVKSGTMRSAQSYKIKGK